MDACIRNVAYIAAEGQRLRAAIADNKWCLSQLAGHDVGQAAAEAHFIEHFLDKFAAQFQSCFCRGCAAAHECTLRTKDAA